MPIGLSQYQIVVITDNILKTTNIAYKDPQFKKDMSNWMHVSINAPIVADYCC